MDSLFAVVFGLFFIHYIDTGLAMLVMMLVPVDNDDNNYLSMFGHREQLVSPADYYRIIIKKIL